MCVNGRDIARNTVHINGCWLGCGLVAYDCDLEDFVDPVRQVDGDMLECQMVRLPRRLHEFYPFFFVFKSFK